LIRKIIIAICTPYFWDVGGKKKEKEKKENKKCFT